MVRLLRRLDRKLVILRHKVGLRELVLMEEDTEEMSEGSLQKQRLQGVENLVRGTEDGV